MFVLITYDVNITSPTGAKRLRKVAKLCQNYGKRVQNSVFECVLNESQFVSLKHQLEEVVDVIDDSIRFYKLGNNWQNKVEEIGKHSTTDVTDLLLI